MQCNRRQVVLHRESAVADRLRPVDAAFVGVGERTGWPLGADVSARGTQKEQRTADPGVPSTKIGRNRPWWRPPRASRPRGASGCAALAVHDTLSTAANPECGPGGTLGTREPPVGAGRCRCWSCCQRRSCEPWTGGLRGGSSRRPGAHGRTKDPQGRTCACACEFPSRGVLTHPATASPEKSVAPERTNVRHLGGCSGCRRDHDPSSVRVDRAIRRALPATVRTVRRPSRRVAGPSAPRCSPRRRAPSWVTHRRRRRRHRPWSAGRGRAR